MQWKSEAILSTRPDRQIAFKLKLKSKRNQQSQQNETEREQTTARERKRRACVKMLFMLGSENAAQA